MYKITHRGRKEYTDSYEEVAAKIAVICSVENLDAKEIDLKVEVGEKGGEWKPLFKTNKFSEGDLIYISKIKIVDTICMNCLGNGSVVVNEYQQSIVCEECNGKGNISKPTTYMEVEGPHPILHINLRVVKKAGLLPKLGWVVLGKKRKGEQTISIHESNIFLSKEDAEKFASDWNQIKKAEKIAESEEVSTEEAIAIVRGEIPDPNINKIKIDDEEWDEGEEEDKLDEGIKELVNGFLNESENI